MNRFALLIALSAVIVPPWSAQAARDPAIDKRYTADYHNCMDTGDAGKGVTYAMRDCMSAEYQQQDARLNRTYNGLMGRLSPTRKTALRTSQRRWLAARDSGCRRKTKGSEGGTIWPLEMTGCQIDATIGRTIWLEKYR